MGKMFLNTIVVAFEQNKNNSSKKYREENKK